MTKSVYQLSPCSDDAYPVLVPRHPRNRGVDWVALGEYLRGETTATAAVPELFVKVGGGQAFDAFHIAMSGWLVSDRARQVLEPLIAQDVVFVPVVVNGHRFWGLRVTRVLSDAVDMELSDVTYLPSGSLNRIVVPVWRARRIPDPALFEIPQMRYTALTTDSVAEAYLSSGCTGIYFWARGGVVES